MQVDTGKLRPCRQSLAIGMALCAAAMAAGAEAQTYPVKPIKLIVSFAPGGPTDIVARITAQKMTEGLGQQVIIDNRPGAGGTLGAEVAAVRDAELDGHAAGLRRVVVVHIRECARRRKFVGSLLKCLRCDLHSQLQFRGANDLRIRVTLRAQNGNLHQPRGR